jgi:hypothetical protein
MRTELKHYKDRMLARKAARLARRAARCTCGIMNKQLSASHHDSTCAVRLLTTPK